MRKEETIRNRPLHELLNYDDDDRIVARTQFEPDYMMSMSSLGSASMHDQVKMNRRWTLLFVTTCLTVGFIAAVSVCVVLFGPRLSAFQRTNFAPDESRETVDLSQSFQRLRESSTIENQLFGAVASDHPICSSLGHHILNVDNGNVVDAAVATALCLGIANPASSGIGGGMFMLIHINEDAKDPTVNNRPVPPFIDARQQILVDENGKTTLVIDAREIAPGFAQKDMYNGKHKDASTVGGLAAAVPGELKGLELAHAMYGKLSWAQVVDPAIRLARGGVPVSAYLADSILRHAGPRWSFEETRKYLSKNGLGRIPLEENDVMTNEALASFLESVKVEGAGALYYGSHTQPFLDEVKQAGGILSDEDLKSYQATIRSPLVAKDVFGYTMVGVPPPSSGGATVMGAARFLSGYPPDDPDRGDRLNAPPKSHRLAEALKHAFAIRMSLSDPAYNSESVADAVNDLVFTDYMESLRKKTDDGFVSPLTAYGGSKWALITNEKAPTINGTDGGEEDRRLMRELHEQRNRQLRDFGYLEDKGTSHFSIVDKEGNSVAMTSSLNTYFGSGVFSRSTGILLNSQMDDFATPNKPNFFGLEPSESNFIEPGKKPLSSMSPTMIFYPPSSPTSNSLGELFMSLGASGGPKIISSTLQTFLNYAVDGKDIFTSVTSPRIHDQLLYHSRASTLYESTRIYGAPIEIPDKTRMELELHGHKLVPISYAGCVQVVARSKVSGRISAVSDIRKGGRPAGL